MDAAENVCNISGPASEGGEQCGEQWEVAFPCWQMQKKVIQNDEGWGMSHAHTYTHTYAHRADYTCATHYTHVYTLAEWPFHTPWSLLLLVSCRLRFWHTLTLALRAPTCTATCGVGQVLPDPACCAVSDIGLSGMVWWDLVPACISSGIWSQTCSFLTLV